VGEVHVERFCTREGKTKNAFISKYQQVWWFCVWHTCWHIYWHTCWHIL